MAAKQAVYFISDLHLEASRTQVIEAFSRFIESTTTDAKAIYILGDFFEAWIGDDEHSPFINKIKVLLSTCASRGTAVYFLHGNRDFLIGSRFSSETGVHLLKEHETIDLFGKRVLLLHGDTLCTGDLAYQTFRAKVRNPSWQAKMLGYPLWVRKLIAAYMRFRSRKANANKAVNIMDVCQKTVSDVFTQYQVNTMIHGHTHRPQRHVDESAHNKRERIVLGDWGEKGWYLRVDMHSCDLIDFTI